MPNRRIFISFSVFLWRFRWHQNLSIQFFYFFFFKYRPTQTFGHFMQFSTALFCQDLRQMISSPFTPASMSMLHSLCDHAPYMVFHRSHIPICQPFWWLWKIEILRLVRHESFPVVLIITNQVFYIFNLGLITSAVSIDFQIPEYFFNLFGSYQL